MRPGQEIVKSDKFGEILLRGAKALRDDGKLFDFTIIADGTRFAAHKWILAAISDFFRAMLQHPESIEAQTNECCLKDITPAAMEAILEFCYTSQIVLDIEKAQDILMAASILQITSLQCLCLEYLMKNMDTTNCLDLLVLADRLSLLTFAASASNFCSNNFDTIIKGEKFLHLDADLLSKILSNDRLCVANEENVLSAIVTWMAADKERAHELDKLLAHVRFVLFDPRNLFNLKWNDEVSKSSKYRRLVDEAKYYHILAAFPEQRSQMVGKRFEPRRSPQECIFVVGGYVNGKPTNIVEKYSLCLNKSIKIKQMTKTRMYASVSIVDDCLYVVGGRDESHLISSVERYNIKEDSWRCDVADMKFKRAALGVCAWNGHIYAIGGVSSGALDVVERYDPATNTWHECSRLRQKRSSAGVTVCNDSIYVMGGGTDSIPVNSVERFNASKNEWSFVAPMTTVRKSFACTTFRGKIYAVGGIGIDNINRLNTGECYDPIEDRWEPIPSMIVNRSHLELVETNGLLYTIGGFPYYGESSMLVEAYDPIKKKWTTRDFPMIPKKQCEALALYSPMTQRRYLKKV